MVQILALARIYDRGISVSPFFLRFYRYKISSHVRDESFDRMLALHAKDETLTQSMKDTSSYLFKKI